MDISSHCRLLSGKGFLASSAEIPHSRDEKLRPGGRGVPLGVFGGDTLFPDLGSRELFSALAFLSSPCPLCGIPVLH